MDTWKRFLLSALALLLSACATTTPTPEPTNLPTALPTAVPPSAQQGEIGDWALPFAFEFPPAFWSEGFHRYGYRIECPILDTEPLSGAWQTFAVSRIENLRDVPIYLRIVGLSTGTLGGELVRAIHPEQATVAIVTIVGITKEAAEMAASAPEDCQVVILWDNAPPQLLKASAPYQP